MLSLGFGSLSSHINTKRTFREDDTNIHTRTHAHTVSVSFYFEMVGPSPWDK